MKIIAVVTTTNYEVTDAEYTLVKHLCVNMHNESEESFGLGKVAAIKFIRDQYGLGLKEAKDIVDKIDNM